MNRTPRQLEINGKMAVEQLNEQEQIFPIAAHDFKAAGKNWRICQYLDSFCLFWLPPTEDETWEYHQCTCGGSKGWFKSLFVNLIGALASCLPASLQSWLAQLLIQESTSIKFPDYYGRDTVFLFSEENFVCILFIDHKFDCLLGKDLGCGDKHCGDQHLGCSRGHCPLAHIAGH